MLGQETEALLLDHDGTVANTEQQIIHSLLTTVSFYDSQRVLTQEEIDAFFGPPLEECYRRLYPEADPGFILNLSRYHNKVGRSSLHLVQLYPKVGETLEKLRSKG